MQYTERFRPATAQERRLLIDVARGRQAPDLLFVNGRVLNVYTGEILHQQVAVVKDRIAYVGNKKLQLSEETEIIDLEGRVLVPGYIEPHAHPYTLFNPVTFYSYILGRGTTAIVSNSDLFFRFFNKQEHLEAFLHFIQKSVPIHAFWGINLFGIENQARARWGFDQEGVIQVSELGNWPDLVRPDPTLLNFLEEVQAKQLLVDGHCAGCSYDTLVAIAAAGVTACHEAIAMEEVGDRLRAGLYIMLRHSSLRPDLPELLKGLPLQWIKSNRIMLTTDGPSPTYLKKGFLDLVIRLAIENGIPPEEAIRMATLAPATYFRVDHLIGGIASGRYADLLALKDITEPTPEMVWVYGKKVAEKGKILFNPPSIPWEDWDASGIRPEPDWMPDKNALKIPWEERKPFPVMRLVNPVITRLVEREVPVSDGFIDLRNTQWVGAYLVGRKNPRISFGIMEGLADKLEGFATTTTLAGETLVFGQDIDSMHLAIETVYRQKGGIALVEGGKVVHSLPLPAGGWMSNLPVEQLADSWNAIETAFYERGYPHYDLLYTMFFSTFDTLPDLRLAPAGLINVKTKEVLLPPRTVEI